MNYYYQPRFDITDISGLILNKEKSCLQFQGKKKRQYNY